MAREPSVLASVMPSAAETMAILAANNVMEAPPGCAQPLGTVGLLIQMADPPPPPLACWGWLGRHPVGARVAFEYVPRVQHESLDQFRLRLAYAFGGIGATAMYCYRPGTR